MMASRASEADKKKYVDEATAAARCLSLLQRVRGGGEATFEEAEVKALVASHELVAGAFPKFGFSGSVGL